MANYNLDSNDPDFAGGQDGAQTFSSALSKVLARFRPGTEKAVNVDVSSDGRAEVWGDGTDVRFHIEPDPDTVFDLGDDPTTELWDAPSPGSGAKRAMEMSSVDQKRAISAVASIQSAPSAIAACDLALDSLMAHIPAESGSILLAEAEHPRFVCVRGPKASELTGRTIGLEHGVAGAVVSSGQPVHVRQARKHANHHTELDQSISHLTRTLLALPVAVGGRVVGVVELLNPFGREGFVETHQTFAHAVALALGERLGGN